MNAIKTPSIVVVREGEDYFCEEDVQLPYRLVRNLGHGHSAIVEMVEDVNTGSVFARKVFSLNVPRTERKRIFDNEIKIIRRLAPHHHIIRVFATYVAKREAGLILHPVADSGDLATFLRDFKEAKAAQLVQPERTKVFESSFGCLASGLAFMHRQKIRHKDIKPHNILIHQGSVIYTDFGYSLDHSAIGRSTTTGKPQAFTRLYCAPEVSDHSPRNSKSDIFSLGCVFLEILFVLYEELVPPNSGECYHESLETSRLRSSLQGLNRLGMITSDMLHPRPDDRLSAEEITSKLKEYEAGRFCAKCKAFMLPEVEELPDAPVPPSLTGPSFRSMPGDQNTPQRMSFNPSGILQRDTRDDLDLHPLLPPPSRFRPPANLNSADPIAHFYNHDPRSIVRTRNSSVLHSREFKSKEISERRSDHKKHMLKHNKYFKCDIPNCTRKGKGFTTIYDLSRHEKTVHRIGAKGIFYQCASETCRNKGKTWARLEIFKQHLDMMHWDEDEQELIRRSVYCPDTPPSMAEPARPAHQTAPSAIV
ncbi:kinase-like protein [Lentithecium fluviatile CBS 122367]|uniref:Kinase-like protein n=1 Tax=Lentithecium fluviatile CBS 122367 TaxID=1168545 RepID=A0A6G1J854_9PLEO|nr:kinase-like protein [Lentithecium fluviatile CBS 122367]